MNDTTSHGHMANSTTNEVSWQSAFWALVPVALNSMTQPCGKIYGFSEEYGFFLRSSPIICAYDAVSIFMLFGLCLVREKSFRKAGQAVISCRWPRLNEELEINGGLETSGLQELQRNSRFRLSLFAAGALPQLVKIYAFTGVPWTKIWATLFLVSFALFEILVISQRKPIGRIDEDRKKIYDDVMFYFFLVTFLFYLGCWCITLWDLTKLDFFLLAVTAYVQLAFIGTGWASFFGEMSGDTSRATFMAFIQMALCLMGHSTLQKNHELESCYYFAYGPFAIAFVTIGSKPSWLRIEHPDTRRFLNNLSKAYIVLLNISIALLCYSLLYDPAGTVKPDWTEYLG